MGPGALGSERENSKGEPAALSPFSLLILLLAVVLAAVVVIATFIRHIPVLLTCSRVTGASTQQEAENVSFKA